MMKWIRCEVVANKSKGGRWFWLHRGRWFKVHIVGKTRARRKGTTQKSNSRKVA